MSKCPVCDTKKGKRQCLINEAPVCSQCCGQTRTKDACSDCSYYSEPLEIKRKYSTIDSFSIEKMNYDLNLQDHAEVIESVLGEVDLSSGFKPGIENFLLLCKKQILLQRKNWQD